MRLSPGAPVLWRGDGRSQVGLRRPVLVEGAEAVAAAALEGPAHLRTMRDHPELAARLRAAGLLARRRPHRPPEVVRLRGLDAAGLACAVALAHAGVGTLSLVDSRARVAAATDALRPMGVTVRVDPTRDVDAEVVVALGTVSPVLRHTLALAGVPHVAILMDEAGASVMPVAPTRTACLDCRERELTRRDSAWPALARQCEAREPWCDAPSALMAGAVAASSLLRLVTPGPPPPPVRVEDGTVTPEPIPRDLACACRG